MGQMEVCKVLEESENCGHDDLDLSTPEKEVTLNIVLSCCGSYKRTYNVLQKAYDNELRTKCWCNFQRLNVNGDLI